jgi:hypothetical protein
MRSENGMFRSIKQSWRQLRDSRPGERFQDAHRRRQADASSWKKPVWMAVGLAVFLGGVVLLVIPGPGIPVVLIGAGLVAREWGAAAALLDSVEVKIRALLAWAQGRWQRSPIWARVMGAIAAVAVAGATLFGAYTLVSGG